VAGYGIGSAFTVIPLYRTIEQSGYQAAFLWFGLGQGAIVCLVALMLAKPQPGLHLPASHVAQTARDYAPREVLRSPLFWLLFVMSLLVTAAGLTFTAHLATIALDFEIADVPVSMLGITLPALTFALTIDRITNGIARPLCGCSPTISAARTRCSWPSPWGGEHLRFFEVGPRSGDVRAAGRRRVLRLG